MLEIIQSGNNGGYQDENTSHPYFLRQPQNEAARAKLESFADEVVYNDLGVPLQGNEILKLLTGLTVISRALIILPRMLFLDVKRKSNFALWRRCGPR